MTYTKDLQTFVRRHIEERQLGPLKEQFSMMRVEEIIDVLRDLPEQHQAVVFRLLPKNIAVNVFDMMDVVWRSEIITSLTSEEAVNLFAELDPEERVELLDELPARLAKHLLGSLSQEQREMTALLMGYERGTVGRIMSPVFVDVKETMSVAEAIERIRNKMSGRKHEFHRVYVTDNTRKLLGVLPLSVLVTAKPESSIGELIGMEEVPFVGTWEDQEVAAFRLEQLNIPELPVVDKENRLIGVFPATEAIEVMRSEMTEDMFDKAGLLDLTRLESDRSTRLVKGKFWGVFSVRVPFLVITLAGGMLAGLVVHQFEELLAAIASLAIFMPVVMDMGGNVGTQSSTIFARALVLGQISVRRFLRHLGREILYGFGIGSILGIIGGVWAHLWQGIPGLGLAVGMALTMTITLAAALGFLIPYTLLKMGLDQAAGSDPIITTIKDISGLLIYFTCVSLFVPPTMLGR